VVRGKTVVVVRVSSIVERCRKAVEILWCVVQFSVVHFGEACKMLGGKTPILSVFIHSTLFRCIILEVHVCFRLSVVRLVPRLALYISFVSSMMSKH
jgi:hypothetical protein